MASKVLVTGGTGLLGSRLPKNSGVNFLKLGSTLNLLESGGVDKALSIANSYGCDAVLHLAWASNSSQSYEESPENDLWAEISIELAKKCVAQGLFFAGLGTGLENDYSNLTPYVIGKRKVRSEIEFELSNGLASWLRPYFVFDIEKHRPRLLKLVLANAQDEALVVRYGNSLHDYISSRDVGTGILEVMRVNLSGIIDIGSGRMISNEFFVQHICNTIGIPIPQILSDSNNVKIVANLSAISKIGWRPVHTEELFRFK